MILRLFCHSPLANNTLTLTKSQIQHVKVLRIDSGHTLELIEHETVFTVRCTSLKKDKLSFELLNSEKPKTKKTFITLVQALPKADKMTDIIRCCTELGVDEFVPVITHRVQAQFKASNEKINRWQLTAESAASQSRQIRIPEVHPVSNLNEWPKHCPINLETFDCKLVFWEENTVDSLKNQIAKYKSVNRIVIVIGPEGGLDKVDVATFQKLGFSEAHLGSTILRVEHAGLVAVSQILFATQ